MARNKTCPFAVGDRIRCIDCDYTRGQLKHDHVYTVSNIRKSGPTLDTEEVFGPWNWSRFAAAPVEVSIPTRLPVTAAARKAVPICTGFLDYFPDAVADVARLSKIGNDQHNPGEPMHWARGKSADQADCILRHQMDRGTVDTDGVLHDAKVAWRAMAQLQLAIENLRADGVAYPSTGKTSV